ncbi:hypothetical protein Vretimale_4601 [Volvox reticuliferus]|nr:hypothetical protein Vretimale_4601 [Volvox reticuliferus]
MPEPPALIFILRLHVEYLIRRRAAIPDAVCRRLPPPLDLGICPADRLDAVPDVLCCPISHGVMSLPVVAPSGTTFDYDSIRRWAQRHNTDPVNGAPLAEGDLYPNLAMRDIVERWLRQQERRACEADPVKAGVERKQEGEEEGDREGSPTHSAPPEEPQPQSGECEDMGHEYAGAGEGVLRDKQSLLPHLVDLS